MIRTNGSWIYFKVIDDMKCAAGGYRVQLVDWKGQGWYYVETYTQRCPRNCCEDSVIKFTAAKDRAKEVSEGMRELADELRTARGKSGD